MNWDEYYEKINDWAVSTAVNKISSLENIGAPDEVVEALYIISVEDEKGAARLLNRALQQGLTFSGENLVEINEICSEESFRKALRQSESKLTAQDLEEMYGCMDDEIIIEIAKKYHIQAPEGLLEDYEEELYGIVDEDVLIDVAKEQGIHLPENLREEEPFEEDSDFVERVQSVMELADYALDCLVRAQKAMNASGSASFLDMVSHSFFPSLLKFCALGDAEQELAEAQGALENLNEGLRMLSMNGRIRLEYTRLASAIELWFDSGFMDCLVHLQMNKVQKRINKAIRQVEDVKRELKKIA